MSTSKSELIGKIHASQYSVNYLLPGPYGKRFITYADYIASGQPLAFLEDFISSTVFPTYANTHTESSFTGLQTSKYREEARKMIKESVNATNEDALIFTGSGSTAAFDLLIRRLIQFYSDKEEKPVVFIGPYEHHSNILPWRECSFDLVEVPICPNGNVDLEFLEKSLNEHSGRTMIGSFSAASNVTGIQAPIDKITQLLKNHGALSFWDYAGAAPYVPIDMNPESGAQKDAVFISPHKLVGGPGTPGILVVKRAIFEGGLPVVTGGGTVDFVTKETQRYVDDIEAREEGGTPAIIESIRAGLAFRLKDMVGADRIEAIEHQYIQRAMERFKKESNIYVLGNLKQPRLGFMAFHIHCEGRFLHHNFAVALLNDLFGIQSRGGCSCAGPYGLDLLEVDNETSRKMMEELGTGNVGMKPGWIRLNFNYFIPEDEFQFILDAIFWVAKHGWKLLKEYAFDDDTALWKCKRALEMQTNSLYSFMQEQPKLETGKARKKAKARVKYFKEADAIAAKAMTHWENEKPQEYKFNQIENPLRWFTLADDIKKGATASV